MDIEKFISEREQEILFLANRIRQFRTINFNHWIPKYKEHKKNAKILLIKAKELKCRESQQQK
jgi:hypothetical protein